ncbi:MAG: hypothetical protein ACREDP_22580 [Bradyrhizobium sp.]
MKSDRVVWCDRGWMPTYYGFCPSEKAWKREMKRLGVSGEPYPDSDGKCVSLEHKKDGKLCCIVTIAERLDKKDDPLGIVGLIVHEAVHVWQKVRADIGEKEPSAEFEAYALQNISTQLMSAYAQTRNPKIAKP